MAGFEKVWRALRRVVPERKSPAQLVGQTVVTNGVGGHDNKNGHGNGQGAVAGLPNIPPPPQVDFAEEFASEMTEEPRAFPSTIELVESHRAIVLAPDTDILTPAQFLDAHPILTTDLLAASLTKARLMEVVGNLGKTYHCQSYWKRLSRTREDGPPVPGDCVRHTLKRELAIISDVHGHHLRLNRYIQEFLAELKAGTLELYNNGDLIHAERKEHVFMLDWSLKTMLSSIMLEWLFPGQVHLNNGNHDVFCLTEDHFNVVMDFIEKNPRGDINQLVNEPDIQTQLASNDPKMEMMQTLKAGQRQVYLFLHYVCLTLKNQGFNRDEIEEIVFLLQDFFDRSPMALRAEDKERTASILLVHSLPIGVTDSVQLDRMRNEPAIAHAARWARHDDPQGEDSGFDMSHVRAVMRAAKMYDDRCLCKVILGHNPPMVANGWHWESFGPDEPFSIIHSNQNGAFGYVRVGPNKVAFEDIEPGDNDLEDLWWSH